MPADYSVCYPKEKIKILQELLIERGPGLVAFSGGLDSTLLLYFAAQAYPGQSWALTVHSELTSPADQEDLPKVRESLWSQGCRFSEIMLDFHPLDDPALAANPPDRCYVCKSHLARLWRETARQKGLVWVMEGSQADDLKAHRPGARALKEANIESPLALAGLSKEEIRLIGRTLGLYGPDRPSQACLASRVPYHQRLTSELLSRIAATERELMRHGCPGARARAAGNLLRLELGLEQLESLQNQPGAMRDFIRWALRTLHPLGWDFITLDLKGYQSSCYD